MMMQLQHFQTLSRSGGASPQPDSLPTARGKVSTIPARKDLRTSIACIPGIAFFLLACFGVLPGRAAGAVFDDFESYAAGSNLIGQGGWDGWKGNASAGALVSSNYSFSPTRAVNITGASDLVHTFSGATNGQWVFSVRQYIPTTSTGTNYVHLLNHYRSPYGANDLSWSVRIQNNMATGQIISDLGGGATRPMVKGQWVEFRCAINLAANSVSEYYNDQLLSTHVWQGGAGGPGLNEIQALDLFANNAGSVYYDNVSLTPLAVIGNLNTIAGKVCFSIPGVADIENATATQIQDDPVLNFVYNGDGGGNGGFVTGTWPPPSTVSGHTSTPPAPGLSASTTDLDVLNLVGTALYSLSVQTDGLPCPPNTNPYVYAVGATMRRYNGDQYTFIGTNGIPVCYNSVVPPVDICECPALVTINFVSCSNTPVRVSSGTVYGYAGTEGQALGYIANTATKKLLIRSGVTGYKLTLRLVVGSDIYTDRITYPPIDFYFDTFCDRATNLTVKLCELCQTPPCPPCPFGEIHGQVDMLGYCEYPYFSRTLMFSFGPYNNSRWANPPATAGCSSGPFTLFNLMPSPATTPPTPWQVYGQMLFGMGNSYQYFQTPSTNVLVPCGTNVDLQNTFVMCPGYVSGNILLSGVPDSASCLQYITRTTVPGTHPADALLSYSSRMFAAGPSSAQARALFDGNFTANYAFSGSYELVLGNLNSLPGIWSANTLVLRFANLVANPDPYIESQIVITDNSFGPQTITCGQTKTNNLQYCFGEVVLKVNVNSGTFYSPRVSGSLNSSSGKSYLVNIPVFNPSFAGGGTFGTPINKAVAATEGQVLLCLPEGTYNLQATIQALDANGIESTTSLGTISNVVIHCGQRSTITKDLQLSVANPPSCSTSNVIVISGTVHSQNPVTSISYSSDAGGGVVTPPTGGWGISPSFAFPLTLLPCSHTYVISATDNAGHTTSVSTPFTFDNTPPVITCPGNKTEPCGAAWNFDAPAATDGCSGTNVTLTFTTVTNGSCPQVSTRTWTAADACGNTQTCSQTVTVSSCVPPPAGMTLWLPLDEASGPTAENLSPGGNHGTQVNGPVVGNGYVGRSLTFNGLNHYVEVPSYDAINFDTNDFSIDAWVTRAASDPGNAVRIIVDKRNESGTVRGYSFFLGSAGALGFQLADGTFANYGSALAVPKDGQWHHVAVTVNRGSTTGLLFYLDGVADSVLRNPVPHSGSVSTTAPLRVGSRSSAVSGNFLGGIDEVELFNRVLAPAEISALFQAGASGKCKPDCYLQSTTATPIGSHPACLGQSVTFSTTAGGSGPFTYVWTRDGTTISGANGPSHTILAVTPADAGSYCVTVAGNCGTVTQCGGLCVHTPPTVTPLSNLTVCAGQSATLAAIAAGGAWGCGGQIELPFYSWTHNGSPIQFGFSSTYTIPSVTTADSGTYCFSVSSRCGADEQCATLEVLPVAPIINCPSNVVVDCASATGAVVLYSPMTVTSPCCPGGVTNPPVCSPPMGLFPIGVTPVTCTVVDACGHSNTCTFTVTVKGKGGLDWKCARRDGGAGEESGNAIAVDRLGNIYVAGAYASPSPLGPNYGGGKSIFVARYNALCNLLWVRSEGGSLDAIARGIALDGAGNMYVTGSFQSSGANTGPYALTSAGLADVFLAKYDPLGSLVWARGFGGAGSDIGMGIAVDNAGNCYVAGEFQSSFVVGTTLLTSFGVKDCFVVKYDSSGAVVWTAQSASATSSDAAGARAIAVDASGEAYVTGGCYGTVSFGTHPVVRNGGTVFVAKYGSSGWAWATHSGNSTAAGDHDGRGIGVDANGFCYVTAYFNGTADFGQHALLGIPVRVSNTKASPLLLYDYFVAKFLATNGSPIWVVNGGGDADSDDETRGLAVDAAGNCYVTGFLFPNAPTRYVDAGQNVLVAKYNSGGVLQWRRDIPGTASDGSPDNVGWGIAPDAADCVYVTGGFTESLNFLGVPPLVNPLTHSTDVFFAGLCPQCEPLVSPWPDATLTGFSYGSLGGGSSVIVLSWTAPGYRLQCTGAMATPATATMWIDVPASSPFAVPASGESRFFRLVSP